MIGSDTPRVASRPSVATLPASGWQREQNSQGRSRSSLGAISLKVRNFKLKLTRKGQRTDTGPRPETVRHAQAPPLIRPTRRSTRARRGRQIRRRPGDPGLSRVSGRPNLEIAWTRSQCASARPRRHGRPPTRLSKMPGMDRTTPSTARTPTRIITLAEREAAALANRRAAIAAAQKRLETPTPMGKTQTGQDDWLM